MLEKPERKNFRDIQQLFYGRLKSYSKKKGENGNIQMEENNVIYKSREYFPETTAADNSKKPDKSL